MRTKILEKGLKYATEFVEDRPEYPIFQYDVQLRKGLLNYELGRLSDAIEDLTILIDIKLANFKFSHRAQFQTVLPMIFVFSAIGKL